MIHIRAANGLGDALQLRAAVLHLLKGGESITVYTRWPEVFRCLRVQIKCIAQAETVEGMRHFAYALSRPLRDGADRFIGMCEFAGIFEPVELRIDWKVKNQALLDRVKRSAAGRKLLLYQPQRIARTEEQELLCPRDEALDTYLRSRSDCFRVKMGHPDFVQPGVKYQSELDLMGRLAVTDAIDLAHAADEFCGEHCYLTTMAEALDKPVTCIYSARSLRSETRAKNHAPERLFHKRLLATVLYDEKYP